MKITHDAFTPERKALLDSIITAMPGAVIAGGYIRDLLLGLQPRDMDILIERDPSPAELRTVEGILGVTLQLQPSPVGDDDAEYVREGGRTSDITAVYKDEFHCMVDILVVTGVLVHISEFPDDTSKAWYDTAGTHTMEAFRTGHENEVIRYRDSAPVARLEKLQAKFPSYRLEFA